MRIPFNINGLGQQGGLFSLNGLGQEDGLYSLSSDDREAARRKILAGEISEMREALAMGERPQILDDICPWIGAFERFRANMHKEKKSICTYCRWLSTYAAMGTLPCKVSCPFAFNGMELEPGVLRTMIENPDSPVQLVGFERNFWD